MTRPDEDNRAHRSSAADDQPVDAEREPTLYDMQWPRAPLTWSTYRWWLKKIIDNDPIFWPIMILSATAIISVLGWHLIIRVIEFVQSL